MIRGLAPALLLVAALPAAAQHKAHAHGAATLDAAVDGARLTIAIEASLEDLVGFERQPRDDRERAAVDAAKAFFQSGAAVVPVAAAGCRRAAGRAEVVEKGKGHAALEATLEFECAQPAALSHAEIGVFARYPRLRRIDARVAGAKGQSAARLTPKSARLAL